MNNLPALLPSHRSSCHHAGRKSPYLPRHRVLRTLIAAAVCSGALAAHAASMNIVTTSSLASGLPSTQNYSTSTSADLATTHVISTTLTSYGSSASGWAEAGAGVIRMDGSVHVVQAVGYVSSGNFYQQGGQQSGAGIIDQVHVNSTTLANGTPVDLLLTLSFAQIVTLSEAASLYLGGGYYATYAANAGNGTSAYLTANGIDNVNATGASAVLHTFVGQYINLAESMSGGVGAVYIDGVERSGHADATHSAHFFVDSLTDGVSLSADSGHDYATSVSSVPEPSSVALMLAGAGLIGWVVRRRGQRI